MLRNILRLMRPKHYLKNGLILIPLLFSSELLNVDKIVQIICAVVIFSLVSSIVYIINDTRDIKKDRKHPTKKLRPLASGEIKVWQAMILLAGLAAVSLVIGLAISLSLLSWLLIAVYIAMNVAYSFGLKNIPVIDVSILTAGFVLRVFFGGEVVDIDVSSWLYLTVLSGAFYMSLGKRRNEILTVGTATRKVNKSYSINFLDKNMYVFLALVLTFYSLWAVTIDKGNGQLFWTIPLVMMILMTYSLSIEKDGSHGDPVDVITNNKVLILLGIAYMALTFGILYI